MVAIQHLAPRPRAVMIMRDILGWSAKETGAALDISVAGVNSALQRARAGLKEHLPEQRLEWDAPGSSAERQLLARYVEASENGDAHAIAALMHEDARFSMPPEPGLFVGRDTIVGFWIEGGFGTEEFGRFKILETRANRQPAIANYVLAPGDDTYRSMALDVLTDRRRRDHRDHHVRLEVVRLVRAAGRRCELRGPGRRRRAGRRAGLRRVRVARRDRAGSSAARSSCEAPAGPAGASSAAT